MTVPPIETVPLIEDAQGVIHVGDTRVTLDTVIAAFLEGSSPEDIVQQYDSLDLKDVYLAIGYYLGHRAEVEHYLLKRTHQSAEIRQRYESRATSMKDLRLRLLARREAAEA